MSPRRSLAVVVSWMLLALAGPAVAQPAPGPNINDLKNGRPWTYQFGKMILAAALALLVAVVVGYLVKSREFRANQKRGGSK